MNWLVHPGGGTAGLPSMPGFAVPQGKETQRHQSRAQQKVSFHWLLVNRSPAPFMKITTANAHITTPVCQGTTEA